MLLIDTQNHVHLKSSPLSAAVKINLDYLQDRQASSSVHQLTQPAATGRLISPRALLLRKSERQTTFPCLPAIAQAWTENAALL